MIFDDESTGHDADARADHEERPHSLKLLNPSAEPNPHAERYRDEVPAKHVYKEEEVSDARFAVARGSDGHVAHEGLTCCAKVGGLRFDPLYCQVAERGDDDGENGTSSRDGSLRCKID